MVNTRFAVISLIGEPNVGKSTLLNRFVGAKVAIVTHKAQTTRSALTGIAICDSTQLAFVDTPGIFVGKKRLDRAMVAAAWSGVARSDIVALMVNSQSRAIKRNEAIIAELGKRLSKDKLRVLVINKIDKCPREELLSLANTYSQLLEFNSIFMISAKTGSGVADLLPWFADQAPTGPWMYAEDQISDLSSQLVACELTREKLLLRLHQELPYELTVETEDWSERDDGSIVIRQVIFVARKTHKKILIGSSGRSIKQISIDARKDIAELLGIPVHLVLRVKVRGNWMDEAARYEAMGLAFPKKLSK